MSMNGSHRFWTVEEIAEYLLVPKSWVYDRTSTDCPESIPHFKVGKYFRFDPDSEEFQTWLRQHMKNAATSR
jgi:excisionase family DNA binding protein